MSRIMNFFRNRRVYSYCKHCRGTWNWKEGKDIYYRPGLGTFQLCKGCFDKLSIKEVYTYYINGLFDHLTYEIVNNDFCNYKNKEEIFSEIELLMKNIKREKEGNPQISFIKNSKEYCLIKKEDIYNDD